MEIFLSWALVRKTYVDENLGLLFPNGSETQDFRIPSFLPIFPCLLSHLALPLEPWFMEDLTGKWACLSLNTRECQTIPLAPGVENNSKIPNCSQSDVSTWKHYHAP